MATLNVIRRWALRDQVFTCEIAKRTGLARNIVKKCLRSDKPEPRYARRICSRKLIPRGADRNLDWFMP